ncbi:hypothetical protein [Coxiella burnetii]|uniref:Uncharacterized protein n=3 Tax=Coxiella burnetii TaxID=777 RepID=Q83ET1_COXBU|nr:hypothetical protein [Coxiella burnetii]NP_819274.1 hypothetical protein CBU_0230 [Coxiella burnetii RSA 493]AAO89788.1 hypothetical protein CBU_0230 [Coxiella burnetii RSA 493]ACI23208.1 hypothetical protein CBUD_1862a [Coxiella burnetii Dugway 5J108-111]ACJ19049.1 hypothetical protein CbuG_1775 [Coxiella burnetii CbuG_Q212]ACJ19706.1 hypothetical protein CbuK_0423 [Coxiella burnetii CbuK_Q154]ALE59699.1 hypothetical protein CBU_0230 [Coxiella burnetii]
MLIERSTAVPRKRGRHWKECLMAFWLLGFARMTLVSWFT